MRILFVAIAVLVLSGGARAQSVDSANVYDDLGNYVATGMRRNLDTYVFYGRGFYEGDFDFGKFKINQNYIGTGYRTSELNFRDEQTFRFDYEKRVLGGLGAKFEQNWQLSSDVKTAALNEMQRLNAAGGLRYDFFDDSYFEALAGAERNDQIGVTSSGSLLKTRGELNDFRFDAYSLDTRLSAEYLSLNYDRASSDVDASAMLAGNYDESNAFTLQTRYRRLDKDFFIRAIPGPYAGMSIENRAENSVEATLGGVFEPAPSLGGVFGLNVYNRNVERSYDNFSSGDDLTGIYRTVNEFRMSASGGLTYESEALTVGASGGYELRDEDNGATRKFEISDDIFNSLRSRENRRDNTSSTANFSFRGRYSPTRRDTLSATYSASMLRYDTPSRENSDDRDRLRSAFSAGYAGKINDEFTARLTFEAQFIHLVYIKAARSSLNNENRIYRLSPSFLWETERFSIRPELEVLANYTIYDFETESGSVKSFSFRQLGYRDSLFVFIGKNLSLQSNAVLRYNERGALFWERFEEAPQSGSFESFFRAALVMRKSEFVDVGVGFRVYRLFNFKIGNLPGGGSDASQISAAPETNFEVRFKSGSKFSIGGSYEAQYINSKFYKSYPNFYILTTIAL